MQQAIEFAIDGTTYQIGIGGSLRPVYRLRWLGTRCLIGETVGWVDTLLPGTLEDNARLLVDLAGDPALIITGDAHATARNVENALAMIVTWRADKPSTIHVHATER